MKGSAVLHGGCGFAVLCGPVGCVPLCVNINGTLLRQGRSGWGGVEWGGVRWGGVRWCGAGGSVAVSFCSPTCYLPPAAMQVVVVTETGACLRGVGGYW